MVSCRRCLNRLFCASTNLGFEVSYSELSNWSAPLLHLCFVKQSWPSVEKYGLISSVTAKPPRHLFHVVCKFYTASKECCRQGFRPVCVTICCIYTYVDRIVVPWASGQKCLQFKHPNSDVHGWVSCRRCLNSLTIPAVQVPTLDLKLATGGYQIGVHCCFTHALFNKAGPVWRKLYCMRKMVWSVVLLPSLHNICFMQYANFILQAKNAADKASDQCMWLFATQYVVGEREGGDEIYVQSSVTIQIILWNGLSYIYTFDSPHKNFTWCIVTKRTSQTTEFSKFVGGEVGRGRGVA